VDTARIKGFEYPLAKIKTFYGKDAAIMMIRTMAKSVYYPVSGRRAEGIRGSAGVRYVRASPGSATTPTGERSLSGMANSYQNIR
jgi:hypothetical protein